jgi:hypothetical protein
MNPELVVLAAGMGSRFGGLKQLESVGPSGETIMDYALYDARRAGVRRVVFVIRPELETAFRETLGRKYEQWLEVDYAFQELDSLPPGFTVPAGRTKPWGTGHAVLAAASTVRAPFLVINADDFYGATAFRLLADWLSWPRGPQAHAMVAFDMSNTLSPHGTVSRGVCEVDAQSFLVGVQEHTALEPDGAGGAQERSAAGDALPFAGDTPVSMNTWGFQPGIFRDLSAAFVAFLAEHAEDPKAEFFLPAAVDDMIASNRASVEVLRTPDRWFGVTYREDQAEVSARLRALVEAGNYPPDLWRQP